MKRTLNDRMIKALKPAPAGQRYDVKDIVVPGLAIRVTDTGQRTYVLRSRFPGSPHANRRALGDVGALTLEQARSKARQWLELIGRGIDPQAQGERQRQAQRRRHQMTFAGVAEDFIADKLPSEKKGHEVELEIRREFMPIWGKRPIADITPLDVRDVIKATKDRGAPYQAHNLLITLRRLFSWAIDQHVYAIETSPCDRLKPKTLIGCRLPRTRIFDDNEWRAFWHAAGKLGYPYGPLFRVLALTGQRKSEVAEARWSEIDLQRRLWTIPAARMKADAAHVVPLTADVVAIFEALPRFDAGDYFFSTTSGAKPVNGFSKAKTRLDQVMAAELGCKPDSFVIHDVRRSMRTGLSALPVPDLVRELVIAHTKPGLHKVYDQHAYLDEKRRALELWSARLRGIVDPAANVIAMPQMTR
jgi:integrase